MKMCPVNLQWASSGVPYSQAMNDCVDIALVGDSAAMVVQGHASDYPDDSR